MWIRTIRKRPGPAGHNVGVLQWRCGKVDSGPSGPVCIRDSKQAGGSWPRGWFRWSFATVCSTTLPGSSLAGFWWTSTSSFVVAGGGTIPGVAS